MTRRILVSTMVGCMAMGCGLFAHPSAEPSPTTPTKATISAKLTRKTRAPRVERTPREVLHAGDTFVHRYGGTFRKAPLTLTEKVVSVEGDFAILDLSLEDGRQKDGLRVKRSLVDRSVHNAWIVKGGEETEVGLYVYDELMAKTAFAADANEGAVKNQQETCLVGQKELSCLVTQYHVRVGGKPATLTIATSEELPGRDLRGNITDQSGKVLYQAELVEMSPGTDASVASRE